MDNVVALPVPAPAVELVEVVVDFKGRRWPLFRHGQEEMLAKDLDLARWLGFANPHSIRKLIDRYTDELGGLFSAMEKNAASDGSERGRLGRTYYLTEQQALYLIAKSDTPKASEWLKLMIAVFMKARRGQLADAQQLAGYQDPAPAVEVVDEVKLPKPLMTELLNMMRADREDREAAREERRAQPLPGAGVAGCACH